MDDIVAEFHYWDYSEYSETAMESRPTIDLDELKSICTQFNVSVEATRTSGAYSQPMRIGWRLPQYRLVIVRVIGKSTDEVKTCVARILLRYGAPDNVPSAFFGGKRVGRIIVEQLIKELRGGKR